jgi:hypothetical protein
MALAGDSRAVAQEHIGDNKVYGAPIQNRPRFFGGSYDSNQCDAFNLLQL